MASITLGYKEPEKADSFELLLSKSLEMYEQWLKDRELTHIIQNSRDLSVYFHQKLQTGDSLKSKSGIIARIVEHDDNSIVIANDKLTKEQLKAEFDSRIHSPFYKVIKLFVDNRRSESEKRLQILNLAIDLAKIAFSNKEEFDKIGVLIHTGYYFSVIGIGSLLESYGILYDPKTHKLYRCSGNIAYGEIGSIIKKSGIFDKPFIEDEKLRATKYNVRTGEFTIEKYRNGSNMEMVLLNGSVNNLMLYVSSGSDIYKYNNKTKVYEPTVYSSHKSIEDNSEPFDIDHDKDTYYALTDGNYGSYEDFINRGGDMGYLYDIFGH